ncbi:hypothetical protein BCU84_01190 [Shewanella sp. 10N.286.51.B7]|uniref:hypothetical protein n=1 Tax=Shewanella sp. 10N.286.51.B7 TaxID=1880836 RepID=UPI000C84D685|nr:hypothetical protein [Shewanella sp. 10N.286.51.B7]PMG77135.1 hypothetical protein BCU84_01190 [Shewanella sp. 10N.286.51.B7]
MSVMPPKLGKVTFESEGTEKGVYHSRILHVPSPTSGLTIGRGYDMKNRSSFEINRDLLSSGIKQQDALLLSKASGLFGKSAKLFITSKNLKQFEITTTQQLKLFDISYKEQESETERLCSKADVTSKYGQCNWKGLDSTIKEILIDLKFRGDYTGTTRLFLQKYVVANDSKGFLKALSDRSNWRLQRVPNDRFQRRIDYFKANAVLTP